MQLLIKIMKNKSDKNFLFYDTVKRDIACTKINYLDNENIVELLKIKSALHDLGQCNISVIQYYNTLNRCLQQLVIFEKLDCECLRNTTKYLKRIEIDDS
ncbi:hypothetical protein KFK09_024602 [Dendrobium nobile]|uniref:Uncharacterized protein n=1 Tax=Dendrobium nobile TaxID=94219 RepID=A0A8T3AEI8_DENNO|nr:hypothetical protein KFK09_024602 [Dendrobium nobile]